MSRLKTRVWLALTPWDSSMVSSLRGPMFSSSQARIAPQLSTIESSIASSTREVGRPASLVSNSVRAAEYQCSTCTHRGATPIMSTLVQYHLLQGQKALIDLAGSHDVLFQAGPERTCL